MQTRRILVNILLFLLKILAALVIVAGICRLGAYAYAFGHSIYDNEAVSDPPGKDVAIVLPEGTTISQAAELLQARGLIRDSRVFLIQERLSKYHGQLQAGNFVLNTSQNAQEMLAILSGHEEDLPGKEDDG